MEKFLSNLLTKLSLVVIIYLYSKGEAMARVLFGEINIQADERGRIRIPSSYREYFGDSALYCTVAPGAKCLSIFGQDVLDKLVDQMGGNSIIGDEEENGCNVRDFFSGIHVINEDKQKRFTLSQSDDLIFEVERNMVFLGQLNRLELWRKSDYDEYKQARKSANKGKIITSSGKPLSW